MEHKTALHDNPTYKAVLAEVQGVCASAAQALDDLVRKDVAAGGAITARELEAIARALRDVL